MAERRVRISRSQAELVRSLVRSEQSTGPFSYQADVLAFGAALGACREQRRQLGETTKEPIRLEVFERQGYGPLVNLLAVRSAGDANVLTDENGGEERRVIIFEEYACGGLEILRQSLRGAVDYLDAILLLIADSRRAEEQGSGEFDLRAFLE